MTIRSYVSARPAIRRQRVRLDRARDAHGPEAPAGTREREGIGAKMAHELKNPLTGVKALVQLGLRNPAEVASHGRLAIVEREVTRMQELLKAYLSFTRSLEEVAPVRVELGRLVSDVLLVLSARAEESRVRLRARGETTAEVDPRRFEEALLNLVANAIEATPPGGEVLVEIRREGDGSEIVIRDSGHGMAPETLRRLGTPFFTTRENGTGLGVMLARAAVVQHGGTLRYESEPGKGTTVRVTLPRHPAVLRAGIDLLAPGEASHLPGEASHLPEGAPPGDSVSLARGPGRSQ